MHGADGGRPDWEGLAKGLLVLGVMWWSWAGYAWFTSVVDPEEGVVRFAIFAAMAAFLVVALSVPEAFDDWPAVRVRIRRRASGADRAVHRGQSRRPRPAASVMGLAGGTAVGVGLLVPASFTDGAVQGALWRSRCARHGRAVLLRGRGLEAHARHFAERHGLIVIIALGESIVAIGIGAETGRRRRGRGGGARHRCGRALWWLYFDVVSLVAERRLSNAAEGRERTRSRATPTPTFTCRWSRASCCWHWV